MPIFSYLAYPALGAKDTLMDDLRRLKYCEVLPAVNEDLLILVTDTPDETAEARLQQQIKKLSSLQSLSMTFGHAGLETDHAKKG